MAATGYTPIQLFYSTTVSQAPSAGSLVSGELAINITDGKLFYKDNGGSVQVIAWKTTPTTAGGTGLTSWTAGDLPYYATGTTLSKLGIGTNGQILTSTGTAPQWSTLSGVAVTTFSAGTTGFTPSVATSGAITLAGTLATTNGGTGLTSFTANGVVYASSTSALTTGSALTFDGNKLQINSSAASYNPLTIQDTATTYAFTNNFVAFYNSTSAMGGIGHVGANDLSIYALGNLAFGASNTEQMRLTSTGLGIGTSTVNTKTQIQVGDVMPAGSGTMNTGVVIQQSGVGQALNFGSSSTNGYSWMNSAYSNNSGIAAPLVFMTGATERMRIDSSGNLGIGTSSPNSPAGSTQTTLHISNSTAGKSPGIHITNGDTGTAAGDGTLIFVGDAASTGTTSFNIYNQESSPICFFNATAEKMRLDSSGNLGLGVTPSAWGSGYKAFEFGSGGSSLFSGTSTAAQTYLTANAFFNGTNWLYKNSAVASYYEQSGGKHVFYTAPSGTAGNAISFTQAMTLDAGWGALLLGTTTAPSTNNIRLSIAGRATGNNGGLQLITDGGGGGAVFSNNGAGLQFWTFTGAAGSESYTERARITSGGDLLVGTTSTGYSNSDSLTLEKSNGYEVINHSSSSTSGALYIAFGYNGGGIGSITQNGTTAVAYNTSSDYRLKNNPQPLTGSGAFIDALKPKTWNWAANGTKGVGFIAHEVQEVSPGSVVGTKDAVDEEGKPVYQAMEYGSAEFIANIIAELQSLRARVAALEAK